jgi:predicted nucleic acid-binding protein
MKFLLDTNIVSEIKKGSKADKQVMHWFSTVSVDSLYLSVLVLGEIRLGITSLRRRDPIQATLLDKRMADFEVLFIGRVLPITMPIALAWADMNVPDRLPIVDSLIAATAKVHQLTLVSRNTKDVARTGVSLFNPFIEN